MPFSVTYAVTSGIQSLIGKPRKSSTELSGDMADTVPMITEHVQ